MRRLAALALAVAGLASVSFGQARQLTVYYNDRPPLYIVNGQTGFIVEIVKLVLDEAKIPYAFAVLPTNRIQEAIKAGTGYSTGIGWFKNPEREARAQFSKPIYRDMPQVALVNKAKAAALDSPVSLDTLFGSGLTLGMKDGYSLGAAIDGKIAASGVNVAVTTVEIPVLVKMIGTGRGDFTILGLEEATYILRNDRSIKDVVIVPLSDPPAGNYRYLMMSKAVDKATVDRINAAIDKVLASPDYRKLTTF